MMTEKELVGKIRLLRQIKPRKDWVVLTKNQILGEEPTYRDRVSAILEVFPRIIFGYKPAFVSLVVVFILFGLFVSAQNSLPGDPLYSLKRISEKTRAVFVSEDEESQYRLEMANKRLEELVKIAQVNQVKKLAPAIEEYQASAAKAAQNLKKTKNSQELKEIVQQTKKLEENKQKVEALGVVIGEETEGLENALSQLVEREIKDLENRTLTEAQQKLLETAEADFEAGNYSQALGKILLLSQ